MRCMNCYQEISDSCKFCPNCGAKQPVQKMEPVSQVKEETIDNITEDTAEVQQPTEKVQSEEDVQPAEKVQPEEDVQPTEKVQPEEDVQPTEKVQPEEDVQPTEPTQSADVAGSYQNDPYKSVTQEQNTFHGESNNYEYGQGYGQQNQNYEQQNKNYTQQDPNYGQQNRGYYQQNNFNGMPQKPVNWVPYLVLSIISTLCCCLPFGVVGIVFSAKINSAMLAGNLEEAQNNAKMARIWIIVSFAIGLLTWLIYMVLIVTGAVSGSAYYYY